MESQPAAFFDAVRAGYLALVRSDEPRFHLLAAALPVDEIADAIWQATAPLLT